MQKIETIKIGRTTYEVVTSFNGNQKRDAKSALVRLMERDAKSFRIEDTRADDKLHKCS